MLAETISFISKKQDERDKIQNKQGRSVNVIKADNEIRDRLQEASQQISQMTAALKRQRKNAKVNKKGEMWLMIDFIEIFTSSNGDKGEAAGELSKISETVKYS